MDDSIRFGIISYMIRKLGENRQYFGKVVIQKIFYFLTSYSKLPLPYEFYFYHFGPYSDLLKHDLEMMQLFGMIRIQDDPKSLGYQIIPVENKSTDECEKAARNVVDKHSEDIDKIVSTFGSEEPADLELSATIHFVFENTKGHCPEPQEHKRMVLDKVAALKPKFPAENIKNKYDLLDKRKFLVC